jgi:hypothetical protein
MASRSSGKTKKKDKKGRPVAKKPRERVASRRVSADGRSQDVTFSSKALNDLADRLIAAESRTAKLRGDMGMELKEAADAGLNLDPFKKCVKLKKKGGRDPIALRQWLRDFDQYRENLNLDKIAATDLFDSEEGKQAEAKSRRHKRSAPEGSEPVGGDGEVDENVAVMAAAAEGDFAVH